MRGGVSGGSLGGDGGRGGFLCLKAVLVILVCLLFCFLGI